MTPGTPLITVTLPCPGTLGGKVAALIGNVTVINGRQLAHAAGTHDTWNFIKHGNVTMSGNAGGKATALAGNVTMINGQQPAHAAGTTSCMSPRSQDKNIDKAEPQTAVDNHRKHHHGHPQKTLPGNMDAGSDPSSPSIHTMPPSISPTQTAPMASM